MVGRQWVELGKKGMTGGGDCKRATGGCWMERWVDVETEAGGDKESDCNEGDKKNQIGEG